MINTFREIRETRLLLRLLAADLHSIAVQQVF